MRKPSAGGLEATDRVDFRGLARKGVLLIRAGSALGILLLTAILGSTGWSLLRLEHATESPIDRALVARIDSSLQKQDEAVRSEHGHALERAALRAQLAAARRQAADAAERLSRALDRLDVRATGSTQRSEAELQTLARGLCELLTAVLAAPVGPEAQVGSFHLAEHVELQAQRLAALANDPESTDATAELLTAWSRLEQQLLGRRAHYEGRRAGLSDGGLFALERRALEMEREAQLMQERTTSGLEVLHEQTAALSRGLEQISSPTRLPSARESLRRALSITACLVLLGIIGSLAAGRWLVRAVRRQLRATEDAQLQLAHAQNAQKMGEGLDRIATIVRAKDFSHHRTSRARPISTRP